MQHTNYLFTVKVLCFDTLLQVLILKVVTESRFAVVVNEEKKGALLYERSLPK